MALDNGANSVGLNRGRRRGGGVLEEEVEE